jgi:hypothetical protein
VHEDGYRVCTDAEGRIVFFTPNGRAIAAAPPPAARVPHDPRLQLEIVTNWFEELRERVGAAQSGR